MLLLRDLPKYECIREQAEQYPEVDPSAVLSCLLLLRVASDVLGALEAVFAAHGLSQGRFTVLMLLNHCGGPFSASDLAERACVSRATMTGLLDSLERDGLIRREPNPDDRRMLSVEITERGREHLEGMLPGYFRRVAELMRPLDESQRRSLVSLLTGLRAADGAQGGREPGAADGDAAGTNDIGSPGT